MRVPVPARLLLLAVTCFAVAACGGSGDDAPAAASATTASAAGTTAAASQVTELDGAIQAFQTTIAGIDGDSLLGDLPTIVSDLARIDTAWTALDQQIEQTCG